MTDDECSTTLALFGFALVVSGSLMIWIPLGVVVGGILLVAMAIAMRMK